MNFCQFICSLIEDAKLMASLLNKTSENEERALGQVPSDFSQDQTLLDGQGL